MKKTIIRKLKMAAYYSFLGVLLQGIILNVILAAGPVEGQNLKNVKVSISLNNVSFEQVLQQIEKNTDFKFFYVKEDIQINEKVTIDVSSESLYEVLKGLALQYNLVFQRINNQIVIKKAQGEAENVITVIETCTIKGYVIDADTKEALQGVTVRINGTTIGTFTDKRGYYEINNLKPGKYSLIASYVGYSANSKEITLSSGKTVEINFQLGQSAMNLDEVVVTGSVSERTIRESSNPTIVVSAKELETKNLTYLTDILGALPGVSSTSSTDGVKNYGLSNPVTAALNIRGTTTGEASLPSIKYFIDGVEVFHSSVVNYLDPNMIERIELSKGPMSSTLYGAGSSSGIIQIFTKKGKGQTHLEFRSMWIASDDKYAYKNPIISRYTLSLGGNKSDFGYNIAANYSMFPVSRYMVNNGKNEVDCGLSGNLYGSIENVKMQFGFNYGYVEAGSGSSPINYLIASNEGWANPERLYNASSSDNTLKSKNINISLDIKHIISNNIYQDIFFGYSGSNTDNIYNNALNYIGTSLYWHYRNNAYENYNFKYFLNWAQPLSADFKFDFTGGVDLRSAKASDLSEYYTSPYDEIGTSKSTLDYSLGSQSVTSNITKGIFGECIWGYKNKLFITTGFRAESDNSYGSDVGWYKMGKFGLTYIMTLGDFTLKPRVSYGRSSDPVNPAYTISHVEISGPYVYTYVGNPDLKPKIQDGYEVGLDLFYGDNYSVSLTYFDQKAKNVVQTQYDQPDSYHETITYINAACITNKGIEVSTKAFINPLTIELSYSYVDARYGAGFAGSNTTYLYDGGKVTGIPATTMSARVTYVLPEFLSLYEKRGTIALDIAYKGNWLGTDYYRYYKTYCETGKYDYSITRYYKNDNGYALVNMNLGYPINKDILLYADVKNLLNYQKVTDNFVALSGRRISFGFKYSIF